MHFSLPSFTWPAILESTVCLSVYLGALGRAISYPAERGAPLAACGRREGCAKGLKAAWRLQVKRSSWRPRAGQADNLFAIDLAMPFTRAGGHLSERALASLNIGLELRSACARYTRAPAGQPVSHLTRRFQVARLL